MNSKQFEFVRFLLSPISRVDPDNSGPNGTCSKKIKKNKNEKRATGGT